jgi:leader peptidase (prepilin peptidase) / N-methyltransferase
MSWLPMEVLLSPWCLALLGLCVGSFLNVVIHRLPLMMERSWKQESAELLDVKLEAQAPLSLSQPRSRCPSCGHQIRWFENVPVVSYAMLKGRCSQCKTPISWRYPIIELLTGALFAAVGWRFGAQPAALLWCAFTAVLVGLSGIDWDTTLLPDQMNQPLLWGGLLASSLGWTALPLTASVWGAAVGYLSLWSVYWLFKLTTGKEGMGYGDFKLLAALGAWLGWQMVLPIVLGASVIGALVGIAMKLGQSLRNGLHVPFGPFLAGAGLVVMLAGSPRVMEWMGWV